MATTLETLERIMLRDALKRMNPELLSQIDSKLIEFASKKTITVEIVDEEDLKEK